MDPYKLIDAAERARKAHQNMESELAFHDANRQKFFKSERALEEARIAFAEARNALDELIYGSES